MPSTKNLIFGIPYKEDTKSGQFTLKHANSNQYGMYDSPIWSDEEASDISDN